MSEKVDKLTEWYDGDKLAASVLSEKYLMEDEDSPEKMRSLAKVINIPFPYFYDESQKTAKKYDAACTPDFSVFNNELNCVYRGQMDGSRPGNETPNDGKDLRKVLNYVLINKIIDFEQLPSLGCNIKWK